ncbi:MAG: ArsJ-associated glyceraldehyde-3-phosphate dehydrogenase [Pseudomonadales bacterium]|nr:ArsJ-associated glyceraldehyde-3-phosphate dehydrogenase [Pseudomonadales bacterium]
MATRIAINGFGRMGKLLTRVAWENPDLEVVHINDVSGNAEAAAHLLNFDSVHRTWSHEAKAEGDVICVGDKKIAFTNYADPADIPWSQMGIEVVVECSGKFKSKEALHVFLRDGVKKVVVSAPVKDGTLNIVMGANDALYDAQTPDIVTAASCTTNCIAPVVKVIQEKFGIKHAMINTIHNVTNTQSVLDQFHPDLRRARSSMMSLIPTSTGSATAIIEIFPELKGRINGLAIRVPLANASLTDCVFELNGEVSVDEVNAALQEAAEGELKNILAYEERPLVSVDFTDNPHSGIVDAMSTMVVNGTQLKVLIWYDNEMGYVHRLSELTSKVVASLFDKEV